ncbi:sulfatase-like hydrolase/transferase [bacterium]|nr:sulfatase-like hydrolase/transferase [bacterium]
MSRCLVVLAVVFVSFSTRGLPARAAENRPNVVLVMTDDQGYGDVGILGNDQIVTPNIDRFASEGVRFSRFYVSPVCAPTRASLMTGRNYYRTGVIHTSRGGAKMHSDEVTIAEVLRDAGYATGIFGKWHLGDTFPMRPQDQGFGSSLVHRSGGITQTPDQPNSYFNPLLWRNGEPVRSQGYCTDVFFDAALRFIEEHREQPFFAYIPTNAPHTPLEVADTYVQDHLNKGLDETTARVYGMVQNIDENFGRLLQRLDALGLRGNTIVIFMTDNGPQQNRYTAGLRGRKSQTYEGGIRVPFFVQWPLRVIGERIVDRIAAHIDLLPTIAAACGAKPDTTTHPLDGISLLPMLTDSKLAAAAEWPDRALFFQCHRGLHPHQFQNCAVVTQQFKLVGSPGTFGREDFDPVNEAKFELYDLLADPGETTDLADSQPEIREQLKSRYDTWFADVKSSRNFTPGVIEIGHPDAPSIHLCRYQDGTWVNGHSAGWSVRVDQAGRYQAIVRRGETPGLLSLRVHWQGTEQIVPLNQSDATTEISLAAGSGQLDLSLVDAGGDEVELKGNATTGDVTLIGPLEDSTSRSK